MTRIRRYRGERSTTGRSPLPMQHATPFCCQVWRWCLSRCYLLLLLFPPIIAFRSSVVVLPMTTSGSHNRRFHGTLSTHDRQRLPSPNYCLFVSMQNADVSQPTKSPSTFVSTSSAAAAAATTSIESTSSTTTASSVSSSSSPPTAQHYSSRQVATRKTQLRWISQSVPKIQAKSSANGNSYKNVRGFTNTYSSALSSFESSSLPGNVTRTSASRYDEQVVHALTLLSAARTRQQVLEAGRLLDASRVCATQSWAVQERVVKAAAMTGLLYLALSITEHMLQVHKVVAPTIHMATPSIGDDETSAESTSNPPAPLPYLPSEICQDALCNALRRAGRIQRLELLLCQMGTAARTISQSTLPLVPTSPTRESSLSKAQGCISAVAFNTFLAALCDIATQKETAASQQQQQDAQPTTKQSSFGSDVSSGSHSEAIQALDRAWYWVRNPERTQTIMAIIPDTISYATVIQAAAMVGNQTLVQDIWQELRSRKIQPNIVAYNARLRGGCRLPSGRQSDTTPRSLTKRKNSKVHRDAVRIQHKKRDEEILAIWDNEISTDSAVSPDKYTIDFLLLPLIRSGRVGDVEALLDKFIKRHSEKVVSNAFTAFLITVVGGGELATARALFETYILPTLSPVMMGDAGGMIRMVRPTTRHFNVLLEGYRKEVQLDSVGTDPTTSTHGQQDQGDSTAAHDEAWALYRLMIQAWGARPDAYTITSMMGLCRSSVELSDLLVEAMSDLNVECSSVVLRAALTAYGDMGDASSALWLFSKFAPKSTRTWNVLLGSLAKVAERRAAVVVKPTTSAAARRFQSKNASIRFAHKEIHLFQRGATLMRAVQLILDIMTRHRGIDQMHGLPGNPPMADSQTFCVAATALQYSPTTDAAAAMSLFRNATQLGVDTDGRFVNAMLRCFGTDIDAALEAWKDEIRPQCLLLEQRTKHIGQKNLVASYHGLLYVCGRALRPDIGLRIVYAMKREGLEPNETSLNSYRSGRRRRCDPQNGNTTTDDCGGGSGYLTRLEQKLYESLLHVECTKYDRNDKRRSGENRVRIIL